MSSSTFDVFASYQAQARAHLYYTPTTSSYRNQLTALTIIYAFLAIISLVSLALRYRASPGFWLFKRFRTTGDGLGFDVGGSYVLPHPVNTWLISSFCFCILMQPYIEYARRYASAPADLTGELGWRCSVWIPLFFGGWQMLHATALAPVIGGKPSYLDSSHCPPWIVNAFFVGFPFLVISILTPMIYFASTSFNTVIAIFNQLDGELTRASLATAKGIIVDPLPLLELASLATAAVPGVTAAFKRVWLGWGIAASALFPVFLVAFVVHCVDLKKTLKTFHSKQSATLSSEQAQAESAALKCYVAFFFTTASALLLSASYATFAIVIVIVSDKFFIDGNEVAPATTLASLWIFAVLGTITNLGILSRSGASSFSPPTKRKPSIPPPPVHTFVPGFATSKQFPGKETKEFDPRGSETCEVELGDMYGSQRGSERGSWTM